MNNNRSGREKTGRAIACIAILTAILLFIITTTALPVVAGELIEAKFTPKSDRDPFMPPKIVKGKIVSDDVKVTPNVKKTPARKGGKEPRERNLVAKKAKGKHPIELPGVSITGIIKTKTGNKAIINMKGKSKIITTGQKLGIWKVSSVGNRTVILTSKNQVAKIVLPSETAFSDKKKK
ncbi:MAG: hypothetical protein K8T10_19630 [Candidatus Eremiobacteraeota bacterium]|nr:hypothetical protein [Candidatus Eremiobacteraeota bacterium]